MNEVETTRDRLEKRLEELRPLLDEAAKIRSILEAMDDLDEGPVPHGRAGERMSRKARNLQILRILRDQGVVRSKDLAEALGVTPGRVAQLVGDLATDGLIERVDGGLSATDAGMEMVRPRVEVTTEVVRIDE
jgi:hypothetical protein